MRDVVRSAVLVLVFSIIGPGLSAFAQPSSFHLNDRGYFERGGVDVMAFHDFYPQGHQSGVTIIQHGVRTASNGDLRLGPTPGQWQPVPKQDDREVDSETETITTTLSYPDSSKNRTGFNPIVYPDLAFSYQVRVEPAGDAVRVVVDLNEPLPEEWIGKVGFNLELFPGALFGKSWILGEETGLFPRQANGPVRRDADGATQAVPLATGPRLTVAPGDPARRMTIESRTGDLRLLDARVKHNKGWFVVRSMVPSGATDGAIEWIIRPHVIPGWTYDPVIQGSKVGYHPDQKKVAIVELDAEDEGDGTIRLKRVAEDGSFETVLAGQPDLWDGDFLRYNYLQFDFSEVSQPGLYVVEYRDERTKPFEISADVYERNVWQPTLETFLPVQMCHMRVEQQNRVWHDACHLDDARMAPPDTNHFDGYVQGPDLLTDREPGTTVPGLNRGGWHDAGDADLRIESQANEVRILASAYELFDVTYDETTIDQGERLVQIHRPDGTPDLLQQIEHGVLTILGGYESLGRLYRGIIVPTLSQYTILGDPATATDNLFYDATLAADEHTATHSGVKDDRMVFTEENAGHEYTGIAALAIAGRVLRNYTPELARESVAAAEVLWQRERPPEEGFNEHIAAAVELLLTTEKPKYRQFLLDRREQIVEQIDEVGWVLGRAMPLMNDPAFEEAVRGAVARYFAQVQREQQQNPYGVPYEPYIWGAGWGIQEFGVEQYFLHRGFPEIVSAEYMFNALSFVLGTHPGSNTASYASGVGTESMTTAYGFNRADWSYIPGGVVSGTALIRPDFPELKTFPYLWQQAEYVMGGGASNYMFLVLAARDVLGGE